MQQELFAQPTVSDPSERQPLHYLPIYRVQLVHEAAMSISQPQLRTSHVVHPREVMKPAILSNSAAIIVAHNHPSGDPHPSQEDRTLTYRLYKAGQLLGIEVLDHIVLGSGETPYFSFADNEILHQERD
jgi:DNA repair protein RadC